jgi:hypothetical protein
MVFYLTLRRDMCMHNSNPLSNLFEKSLSRQRDTAGWHQSKGHIIHGEHVKFIGVM